MYVLEPSGAGRCNGRSGSVTTGAARCRGRSCSSVATRDAAPAPAEGEGADAGAAIGKSEGAPGRPTDRRVGYAEVDELVSDSEIDGRPEIQRRGASQEGGWWVYRVNLQPHLLVQAAQASAISTWLALGEVCFRGLLLLTEREVLLSSRLLWPDL